MHIWTYIVSDEYIDASVGLAFSLQMLRHYKRSGILRTTIRRFPGLRGPCQAFISLVNGVVTECFLEDHSRQRQLATLETLLHANEKWGPFEWIFQPLPAAPHRPVSASSSHVSPQSDKPMAPSRSKQGSHLRARHTGEDAIPLVTTQLSHQAFMSWRPLHKHMLHTIVQAIDGRRTIRDIKAIVPYSSHMVDETLRFLVEQQIISFVFQKENIPEDE